MLVHRTDSYLEMGPGGGAAKDQGYLKIGPGGQGGGYLEMGPSGDQSSYLAMGPSGDQTSYLQMGPSGDGGGYLSMGPSGGVDDSYLAVQPDMVFQDDAELSGYLQVDALPRSNYAWLRRIHCVAVYRCSEYKPHAHIPATISRSRPLADVRCRR